MEALVLANHADKQEEAGRPIDLGELAYRIRWRRYILSRAASNHYLESPSYLN